MSTILKLIDALKDRPECAYLVDLACEVRRELVAAQARDEDGQRKNELAMKTCGELRENLENAKKAREQADAQVARLEINLVDQMREGKRLGDALKHAEAEAQKDHHQIQRLAAGLTAAENELADLRWLNRLARIASNSSANFAPSRDHGIGSRKGATDAEKGGAA